MSGQFLAWLETLPVHQRDQVTAILRNAIERLAPIIKRVDALLAEAGAEMADDAERYANEESR